MIHTTQRIAPLPQQSGGATHAHRGENLESRSTLGGKMPDSTLKEEAGEKVKGEESFPLIKIKEEEIEEQIKEINEKLLGSHQELQYHIHERTQKLLIKLVDTRTKEVIKEIPEEKLVDIMADICEGAGLLIDEKV